MVNPLSVRSTGTTQSTHSIMSGRESDGSGVGFQWGFTSSNNNSSKGGVGSTNRRTEIMNESQSGWNSLNANTNANPSSSVGTNVHSGGNCNPWSFGTTSSVGVTSNNNNTGNNATWSLGNSNCSGGWGASSSSNNNCADGWTNNNTNNNCSGGWGASSNNSNSGTSLSWGSGNNTNNNCSGVWDASNSSNSGTSNTGNNATWSFGNNNCSDGCNNSNCENSFSWGLSTQTPQMSTGFHLIKFPKPVDDKITDKDNDTASDADKKEKLKLAAVIITICDGSTYDNLFSSVEQDANAGTRVAVYAAKKTDIKALIDQLMEPDADALEERTDELSQLLADLAEIEDPSCVAINYECCSGIHLRICV